VATAALLLSLVALLAITPATGEAVAVTANPPPLEPTAVLDHTPGHTLAGADLHPAADPRGPPIAAGDATTSAQTRYRVSTNAGLPRDRVEAELTHGSRWGYERRSGSEVVGSLDVPRRGAPRVNLLAGRSIQVSPAEVRFGAARGGGGGALARRYARQVTGGAEKAVYVRDVECEGIRSGTLLDAKYARSEGSVYDISGVDRFTRDVKIPTLLGQARRQLTAIRGLGFRGIEWHFADEAVAASVRSLFVQSRIPITVRYTPLIGVT